MSLDIPDHVTAEIRRAQALAVNGDVDGASAAYRALLEEVSSDAQQAVAVLHMWAIVIDDPHEKLAINEEALRRADEAADFPAPLRASLLANLGFSHQALGDTATARSWYLQARGAAAELADDDYGAMVREGIERQLELLTQ